jgi:hypothetical protein
MKKYNEKAFFGQGFCIYFLSLMNIETKPGIFNRKGKKGAQRFCSKVSFFFVRRGAPSRFIFLSNY